MAKTLTPMMRQYRRIKGQLPAGVILFFRLGDFYEMFFEDAAVAAPVLDIALTKRNGVPMCGVPYHAVDTYVARLVRAGHKVAVCDQVGDAAAAKGIVRREVSRVVTAGTVTEAGILEAKQHHYLAGVHRADGVYGLALLDLSTGRFFAERTADEQALAESLRRYDPGECVVAEGLEQDPGLRRVTGRPGRMQVSTCDDWVFAYDTACDRMTRHFGVHSLGGFGCEGDAAVTGAAGAVLHYVQETLHRDTAHVRAFSVRQVADYLLLDEATCRNLDLVPVRGRETDASLLKVLDATCTPMGGRLLRDWVLRPPAVRDVIVERHDAVEQWCRRRADLTAVREALGGVRDLERLIGRLGSGTGSPRDAAALAGSLGAVPAIREIAQRHGGLGGKLAERLEPQPELVALVGRALVDEPPASTRDGGIIRAGYHEELDRLRGAATEGRNWLARYQAQEQERTGIRNLKVRYNKVFGYYIEVSKGQLGHVPDTYVRKQTLVNAERFITPELKEHENHILGAQERSVALEQELFEAVRATILERTEAVQRTAAAVGTLDVLAALADRALALRYVRPRITDGDAIRIRAGRHPVVEQMPEAEHFVPNDTRLDGDGNRLIIITGPNMAGKSTYIRQVALITVMAHAGSFVPAEEAEIGVVDRVFTRVGASDDIMRGRSTFMVEMQETANILNNATARSLIVLDEIGRGTSTFDGISIAWAVAEHLHNDPRLKAKTLFATHYHELTDLARTLPGVKNYNILVREHGDRIVFLRRIAPGAADQSYGIQVGRLAGLPPEVIDRAGEILANLEEGELGESGQPKLARHRSRGGAGDGRQLRLF